MPLILYLTPKEKEYIRAMIEEIGDAAHREFNQIKGKVVHMCKKSCKKGKRKGK
jgi:hypothetical protein